MRFSFQGTTSLLDWRHTNEERLNAMHTHWGGPAFWVPPSCPSLRITSGSSGHGGGGAQQLAAAARPDTARGPRPARQMSRLGMAASASEGAPLPSARSMGSGAPLPSSRSSRGSCGPRQAYTSDADSGALTARGPAPEGGLVPLTMDQLVAEVRRSCPISWSASLRVRVNLKLLGGAAS